MARAGEEKRAGNEKNMRLRSKKLLWLILLAIISLLIILFAASLKKEKFLKEEKSTKTDRQRSTQTLEDRHSRTFFVSNEGNDENPGTISKSWRTIQFAANQAESGDKVIIKKGVYQEIIVFQRSGTKNKPILFQAEKGVIVRNPAGGPGIKPEIFTHDNNNFICGWGEIIRIDADYLILDGFEVIGAKETGLGKWGCKEKSNDQRGMAEGQAKGIVYRNLVVRDHLGSGLATYNDSTIQNSVIKNNGVAGDTLSHGIYTADSNNLIENNILEGNSGYGLHLHFGGRKNIVRKNTVYRNGYGGIVVIGRDNDIYNNTFVLNGYLGGWFSIWPKDGQREEGYISAGENRITNNIFAFNKHEQVSGEGDKNNIFKKNLCYANSKIVDYAPSTEEENSLKSNCAIFTDPQFEDLFKGDFNLTPNSLAIDNGLDLSFSFKGKALDIGAKEYEN